MNTETIHRLDEKILMQHLYPQYLQTIHISIHSLPSTSILDVTLYTQRTIRHVDQSLTLPMNLEDISIALMTALYLIVWTTKNEI